jgi:signal transduction histidine kinase
MASFKPTPYKDLFKLSRPKKQALLVLIAVAVIDFCTPLGVSWGVLYLLCFFLLCKESKQIIIAFSILTMALTLTKWLVYYAPEMNNMSLVNRVITLLIINVMTVLVLRHKKLDDKIMHERNVYAKELEEMLFMVSHKLRKPITSYLGLVRVMDKDKVLTQEELKNITRHITSSAIELDSVTKELTKFMYGSAESIKNKNQSQEEL